MCEPCTSRTRPGCSSPRPAAETSSTHGPAALTSTRAAMVSRFPEPASATVRCHASCARDAATARARVRMRGAALGRIARVEDDEAGIVDPAVGILEAGGEEARFQRRTGAVRREIEDAGAGQALPAAQVIVEEERRRAASRQAASPPDAAARSAGAARCGARCATAPRARPGPRAPAGNRTARGSAGRRGSAWWSARRCRRQGRPSRTGTPTSRGRQRRGRCRSR